MSNEFKHLKDSEIKSFISDCFSEAIQKLIDEKTDEIISEVYARIAKESYTDYPKAASDNAKRALKFREESGNPNNCGTAVGWTRANQLAKREPISRDTIARMSSFNRHRQNKDVPYEEGCGGLMWDAWGGDEGIAWAQRKLKEIDEE